MTSSKPPAADLNTEPSTLHELWARHSAEEKAFVRRAFEAAGWSLYGAARLLGCPPSSLQWVLRRHPDLAELRRQHRAAEAERRRVA